LFCYTNLYFTIQWCNTVIQLQSLLALLSCVVQVAIAIMDEKLGDRVNVLNSTRYRTRQKQARLHDLQLQYKQYGDDADGEDGGGAGGGRGGSGGGGGKRGDTESKDDTTKSGDGKEDEEGQVP